jgi:hypothetical protein
MLGKILIINMVGKTSLGFNRCSMFTTEKRETGMESKKTLRKKTDA